RRRLEVWAWGFGGRMVAGRNAMNQCGLIRSYPKIDGTSHEATPLGTDHHADPWRRALRRDGEGAAMGHRPTRCLAAPSRMGTGLGGRRPDRARVRSLSGNFGDG